MVFGLCPSSGILKTREHISETGPVSVLKWEEEDTSSVGSLLLSWVMTPCSLVGGYQHFKGLLLLSSRVDQTNNSLAHSRTYHISYPCTWKYLLTSAHVSRIFITIYETAQCYIPEDHNLNFHHHGNLKSHTHGSGYFLGGQYAHKCNGCIRNIFNNNQCNKIDWGLIYFFKNPVYSVTYIIN
jgi:hypothetical protein